MRVGLSPEISNAETLGECAKWNAHRNPTAVSVAQLFNSVYQTTLLMLMQYYSYSGETAQQLGAIREAIRTSMSMCIRPISEILTRLPLKDDPSVTAGPGFELTTDLRLPTQLENRWTIVLERMASDSAAAKELAKAGGELTRLDFVGESLRLVCWQSPDCRSRCKLMIAIRFAGRFQSRLATDPDPTDERRGVSGYIWAVAGEPDLDRIIRFQQPTVERTYSPKVGVLVTEVVVDGTACADHVLLGASVNLLGGPKFEVATVSSRKAGRNLLCRSRSRFPKAMCSYSAIAA
jgi:hypothetical protein